MSALGQQEPYSSFRRNRPLSEGDFNRSMQHLSSNDRAEDVAYEAKTEDLLQRRAKELDVGSPAGRRFSA
jgi:hypothetical protein